MGRALEIPTFRLCIVGVLALTGCDGRIGGSSANAVDGAFRDGLPDPAPESTETAPESTEAQRTAPLESCSIPPASEPTGRKKTNLEIRFALEDLSGRDLGDEGLILAPNPGSETFPAAAGWIAWNEQAVTKQVEFAEMVAERLHRDNGFIQRYGVNPRDYRNGEIPEFVRRMARAFLGGAHTDALVESLSAAFVLSNTGRQNHFYRGVRNLVFSLILDPHFLYEVPPAEGKDGAWAARRMAHAIWRSVPDDELLNKAASEELTTKAQLTAEIQRMLQDPKAKRAFRSLAQEWFSTLSVLNVQRSPEAFPYFSNALIQDMENHFLERLVESLFDNGERFSTLMGKSLSPVPESFEPIFQGSATGENRRGLLTHPLIATLTSEGDEPNAVKRATYTLRRFLCIDLPPPPDGAGVFRPLDLGENPTTRERFAAHTIDPSCASCHSVMDGIGLAMEQYDAMGAFRTEYPWGVDIDPTGSLAAYDKTLNFSDVSELQGAMQSELSEEVDLCLTRHVIEGIYRAPTSEVSECLVSTVYERAEEKSYASILREAIIDDAFWRR